MPNIVHGVADVSWVRFTYPFNLTRSPAGTVCAGFTGDAMPVGLQVVGRFVSLLTPSRDGPRQCGQVSAAREATVEANSARVRSCRRMVAKRVPISLRTATGRRTDR